MAKKSEKKQTVKRKIREKEMEEHESQQHEHNHGEHNATTVNTSEAKIVARTFRYMRRKPTIIAYKPPEGN